MNTGFNTGGNHQEITINENANFFTNTTADRVKYLISSDSIGSDEYLKLIDTAGRGEHSEETFLKFITHGNEIVCFNVAANPKNIFPDILDKLSYHSDDYVREQVAMRKYTSISTLKRLYQNDKSEDVRNHAFQSLITFHGFWDKLRKQFDIDKFIEESF